MNKPARQRQWCEEIIKTMYPEYDEETELVLFGCRGYFRDSMGAKGRNDRAIYDDGLFILSPTLFSSFNANTDPSIYRKGSGTGSSKGVASLKAGVWLYQKGLHRGYQAFTQANKVTVIRDGDPPYEDTGYFGINIHRGGTNSTSSLGCQTLIASQWYEFKNSMYLQLDRLKQKKFKYILAEKQG